MRLRVLETNAGTVLVLDKVTAGDVDTISNAWQGEAGRGQPLVIASENEVEIPLPDDRTPLQRWYQGDYYSPPPAPYTSPYTYCTYKPGGVAS